MFAIQNENDAIKTRREVSDIFRTAHMNVHKWSSNSPTVLKTIPEEQRSPCKNAFITQNNNITFSGDQGTLITKDMKAL